MTAAPDDLMPLYRSLSNDDLLAFARALLMDMQRDPHNAQLAAFCERRLDAVTLVFVERGLALMMRWPLDRVFGDPDS